MNDAAPSQQPAARHDDPPLHDERLWAPLWWWLVGGLVAFTFVVAVWWVLTDAWAIGAAVVFFGGLAAVLLGSGRGRVRADETSLHAGGANVEWEWVSGAVPLNAKQSDEALARADDGRTWLFTRPWLKTHVRVRLADPADRNSSWLVATRRPRQLATVVLAHAGARRPDDGAAQGADQAAPAGNSHA
ncbi:DUF3093 domain-containing protein [Propionibacteriaceae bacterium G1746]|uniref:DUF3093 domain-containing protein n=1 Tax=Aestuariimicrobium sp. G57 TaxID=3418485 RepID=UPI003C23CB6B